MDKAYLLIYTGTCSSTYKGGIKFTTNIRTALISEEKVKEFQDKFGKSLYDDIEIRPVPKLEIVPEEKKELTVDGLKKAYTLDQLQAMARDSGLDATGSKTEIAERIVQNEQLAEE